ncbi:MAG: 30S ribosomal protein S17 [Limnobacter sp.]|uniref:30S ribosomal protein S17 n=1 Tax=Limnobacter sp. TaxID=2003368 RepID=UPI00391DFD74
MNAEVKTSLKRSLVGRVISDKMTKSVVVAVENRIKHPVYGKFVVQTRKFTAHDETNEVAEGDLVEISEGRPISKTKSWSVTKVLEKAKVI